MTNSRYQLALRCINHAFSATPYMRHEESLTLRVYVETLADAWEEVHKTLLGSGLLGDALATMQECNWDLSGNSYKECTARRESSCDDYEDVEWLHDMYGIHLEAMANILNEMLEAQP